jgi:hypothetical protein
VRLVTLMNRGEPFDTGDVTTRARLLLGTIANLDRLAVTSRTDSSVLTSEEATKKLGFDVKELGRDEAKLTPVSVGARTSLQECNTAG